MSYSLKRLSRTNLEAAIARAAHYRDLNQPEEAESICRDVLDVDPENQQAWKLLGLALTDQFAGLQVGLLEEAIEAFERLTDDYERVYHVGVAWERAAKAHLERNEAHSAVTAFEHALRLFEKAEQMRPESPDPVLRWNRCVRLLSNHPSLRAAIHAPREDEIQLGD
ncbi:MAG TPA: tetratricopeptide repeat protein [Polyangiaceae bacterium]|jgi:tetratricopeptide (TPR) repeat protein